MERRQCRGEVTAYLSLIFLLLITFVAGLMESASIQMAKNYRRADMNRAMECMFAEYQKELLEEYEIFAIDGSYETGQYSEENLTDRLEFYGAGNMKHKIERIQFLTDHGCSLFYDQVAAYMEDGYGIDAMEELVGQTPQWGHQEEKGEGYLEEERKQNEELEALLGEQQGELPSENNPIEHVGNLKQSPVLNLVMPKERQVSEKKIALKETPEFRTLNQGYGEFSDVAEETGTLSALLFGEYLLEHFTAYTDEERSGALEYELEYILAGKGSDQENLEHVVNKLMLIRYVPNYAYLQTNAEKKAEAKALALTLCSLLAVPAITEAAAQVILLSWAYGETVMDLRSLLGGSRVPLVKDDMSWQLSLSSLMSLGTEEDVNEGKDTTGGMDYRDYLRMLLFLEGKEARGLRTLGMIEQNLRKESGLTWFKADLCVGRMELWTECRLRREIQYRFPTYYGYQ